jgi:hypothetical protein
MSLSTIQPSEVLLSQPRQPPLRNSLLIDDIQGVRTQLKGYQYPNKLNYALVNTDIEKSMPR